MKRCLAAAMMAVLTLLLPASAGRSSAVTAIPLGLLPNVAIPAAYRIDLTVDPDQPRFSGHVEIDVTLRQRTNLLYIHGRDLRMARARVRTPTGIVRASYAQVEQSGIVRLRFARPIDPGAATLLFDYDAPFGDGPAGFYRVKVGERQYAWTQFEAIDARAAFPGFDQPGYKTPFTISLTTRPGLTAISNAPEVEASAAGTLIRHVFAPTKPLPTYLVAFAVGPFATASGVVPPSAQRREPLPLRIVGTAPNRDKLAFALENSASIVALLEGYFGRAFPFPKLDQIGSPVMSGAMENAGADVYGDTILLLDRNASTDRKKEFGMVVAHELSHQWFGDLVTPAWWDDLWLNESFANWMGYRIGDAWQPELKIGAGAIGEGFAAMNVDALRAGRPIHQKILTGSEVDSTFDEVVYGKGGHVVAMIAAYLGDDTFRDGVRRYLDRHAYGSATTDQFFAALAEGAHDPRLLASLRSFVDQQGVPLVRFERTAEGLAIGQRRYALLGSELPPQSWIIPVCVRSGEERACTLLDGPSTVLPMKAGTAVMPNAGGTGYYRFSLDEAEWHRLIASSARLGPGEAQALTDSLWAGFQAGELAPDLLLEAARAMAANPYSVAASEGGRRLAGLRRRGLIEGAALPGYRAFLASLYRPRLAELSFDPRAGAHAGDDPDRQKLRADLVDLLAGEAEDGELRARLSAAATAWLAGSEAALDQNFLHAALAAWVATHGRAEQRTLLLRAAASDDTLFRDSALAALGSSGDPATGRWLLGYFGDKTLRANDLMTILLALMNEPATRDLAQDWLLAHYDDLVKGSGLSAASGLPALPSQYCSVAKAAEIRRTLQPKVDRYGRGQLPLDRTTERVQSCGLLKERRGAAVIKAFR